MNPVASIIVAMVLVFAFLVCANILSESDNNENPTYDNPDTQPVYKYNRTAEPPKGQTRTNSYARDDAEPDDDLDNNQGEDNGDY